MIYITKNQALEIDPEILKEPVIIDVKEYVEKIIVYRSKDGKSVITNFITGLSK